MKKTFIFLGFCALLAGGCTKKEGDYTTDPNTVVDAPLKLLLPPAEVAVALAHGSELAWYSSIFMQQQAGVDRQMAAADRYVVPEGDMNRPWNSAYTDALNNLQIIIRKADAQGATAYAGIARILTAQTLGLLTDAFGDIPYSQALQQSGNITPAYDAQENIYISIQELLSRALTDLEKPSPLLPAADDIIYNGDLEGWKKTARVLQARYHNHLSRRNAAASATAALAALDAGGYAGNEEEAKMLFGMVQTAANPWYQFVQQRGDVRMGEAFVSLLKNTADPRLPRYAAKDDTGGYSGSPAGRPLLTASRMGMLYASIDSPIPLVTFAEQKGIEAEAALRAGDRERAARAHNEMILASLKNAGVTDAVFQSRYAAETGATITLEKIITQKHISLFSQSEVWTDYRRTGFPLLVPLANGALGNTIPRRLPYPLDERSYNAANVPAGGGLSGRVWWDL